MYDHGGREGLRNVGPGHMDDSFSSFFGPEFHFTDPFKLFEDFFSHDPFFHGEGLYLLCLQQILSFAIRIC